MKIICAYCGKYMDEVDGRGVDGVSHGICDECINIRAIRPSDFLVCPHCCETRNSYKIDFIASFKCNEIKERLYLCHSCGGLIILLPEGVYESSLVNYQDGKAYPLKAPVPAKKQIAISV